VLHSSLRELPSFALQIGLGAASGGLSTGFMGLSSAADKWAEVVDDDSLSFRQKAAMIGIHSFYEMVMEQLNTIPLARRLGSKAQGAVFREMVRNKQWKAAAWKAFKQVMGNITEEGAEEFFTQMGQDLSDALIRNGEVTDEDVNNAFNNSVEAFIGGAAMGAAGVGFEGASYLPVDAATSRKYFQQQLGGKLPEKYATKAARQKALDDYELHGTPITEGEPTANDRALAFAERLNAYNHMDDEQRKQYEPYVQEWRDGFDAAMDEKIKEDRMQTVSNFDAYRNRVEGEMFTPLNEEGKPVEVVEIKEEEKKPTVTEAVAEPVTNETVTETVTEKPAEPPKEAPKHEPKEEPKAQEWTWTAEHPNHEKAPGGHVEIVSADDVVTDSDEGAIDFLQNRNVGAERSGQIIDIAENPNTDLMFIEGLTDKGMPVAIRRDGKLYIVAGMGRTKARRLMGQKQTDAAYLERLKEVAGKHGMSVPEDMKNAFAVRVIDENLTDEQLKDFVRQANMEGGDKLGMDAAERAADDAAGMEKHGDELIGLFRELDNDSIVSASNKEFITKFRDLIGKRDGDVDSNGNPTDQFEKRVANAFLGMLFKNMPVKERSDLLNRLVNHADKYGVVGLYRALAKKSPKLIKLETANKDYGLTDILPNVLDALMDFKANREQFKNEPEMYLNQLRLDGRQLNVDERELFKILAGAKSMAQAARLLQSYVDKARMEISSPLLFGVVRKRGELLVAVNNAAEEITQGGTAADAYLENGTLEDADVPLVEGATIAPDEKTQTEKNSLLRNNAKGKVSETVYMDLNPHGHAVTDSYVDQIKEAAEGVADAFGIKVIVHRNDYDLPEDVQQDLVEFGGNDNAIQAWVDESDNVVHLVASQMESSEMAVQKTLHEIIGHIGLAALFKGRNTEAWNNMVENLWEHHKADIRERCQAYLADFDENTLEGRSELVEEWLARLAETKRKPMWWKTVKSRIRQLLRMLPGLHDLAISDAEIEQMLTDAATAVRQAKEAEGNSVRFSIVKDKNVLDKLNNEETITVYRAMQMHDGKLYPPMAGKINGEWVNPTPLDTWMQADEFPELAKDGKFKLDKGNGTSIWAAYNPYWHTSRSPLNDQFSSAYKRPELVTVKCEVPASELTSGYKAEGAKDAVGEVDWKSGGVSGALAKADASKTRKVILSRYVKVIGVVPDSEVAQSIKELLGDTGIAIPDNVVTPSLRGELEAAGVSIKESGKVKRRFSMERQEAEKHSRQALQDIADGKEYGVLHNKKYGEIRYPLGSMGKHGHGLLHIIENRMQRDGNTLEEAIDIALNIGVSAEIGKETESRHNTRHLDYNGIRAIIALMPDGNKVITGYEIEADDSSVAKQRADNLQSQPHVRSAEIVAALKDKLARENSLSNGDDKKIRYSMVKEGTQPLPSGPEPSINNILQRAAKSPIDVNHLHALRLPLIHELAKQLGGNVKAVDRINIMKGTARGVFYEGPERLIKVIRSLVAPHQLGHPIIVDADMVDEQEGAIKEYWKGRGIPEDEIEIIENEVEDQPTKTKIITIWHDKSQAMLRKTLAHEVGHLIDYNVGETTKHGNVLGTVGGIIKGYLLHTIAESPENWVDWKKRKRELFEQAKQTFGECPEDENAKKKWFRKVNAEYRRLIVEECDKNNMFRVETIRDELIQNSKWWRGEWGEDDPNYARYRKAPTELFADAMSILLNAPDKFMEQLPETWRMLQNYQSQREDFHKAWQGMMRLMENEDAYADTLMNMAKMGYATDEHTIIQINKDKASFWRAMKRKYVDSFAEVNDASKRMLRSGEAEWDDVPMPAITAAQHQSIKDYYLILAERLAKPLAKAGIIDEQIGQYLEYQRIVNDPSINQGHIINPHGLDVHSAELNLEKLHKDLGEEKWKALQDWHKEFWKLRQDTIVKMIEQSGMYSKELVQHIKENEWYSYRAVIDQIYNADGTEKPGVGKIYGLKGTFSPIGNPLGWTYDHDLRLMGGILWNVARRDTIEFMKEHYPMLVQKVNAFSRSRNIVPAGYVRMTVLEGNKSVDYNVAETWALGFMSKLNTDTATILRTFQGITNMYRRVWTMLSPTFLLNNLVRDYLASYQNISGINRNIGAIEWTKCWLQGMKEAFKFNFENKWLGLTGESDIIEEMMKNNMFQSGGKGYDMSERNGQETGSKRMDLLRRYGMIDDAERKNIVRRYADKIGDFIERMVDATEKGAKAGGFLALQRNNKDMSDAERQWHIVRHIGSPDFAQRGTATPIINTIFIFSNAAMQGWNGTLEMAKANPKAFAARWMATTGTAVFIGWLLESGALRDALKGMGADDDDDTIKLLDWLQKMYGKITHYNRYNYMCLPFAEREDGYVWTLRLPFAENSKLPAMLMHGALDEAYTKIKKDKNLMNEVFDATLNQSPNVNPLGGLTRDVLFMLAGKNPRDFYRGREAVKSSEWDAGGTKRLWGSVKYLTHEYTPLPFVNQLFDLRDNPYWWWNIFGSITGLGAWFKPQLYGEAEQNKAVTAEKRRRKLSGKAEVFGGRKAQ